MLRLLTVLGFIFGLVLTCTAQEEMKVYETKNGVRSTMPSQKVVKVGDTYKVYAYQNGVRKVVPYKVIKEQPANRSGTSTYKQYNVRNSGVRETQPSRVIIKSNSNNNCSSGNWW